MDADRHEELSRVLREWQAPNAPPSLEARVLSACRDDGRRWNARTLVTAAIFVVGAVLLSRVPPRPVHPAPMPLPVVADADGPFVPVPFVAPLDSYETATVLRGNIPVAALLAAGYRVSLADPGALVLGDVLVGDDGRVHAVRLLAGLTLEVGGD
jgi:hypothetical protein